MSWKPLSCLVITMCLIVPCLSQTETEVYLDDYVNGTLCIPDQFESRKVALIIQGSGPTDRNGNNASITNNSLKMLADSLAYHGIASLRYDKRGIANSQVPNLNEADMSFDQFTADARGWVHLLHQDDRFNDITVIGHSQGSLVGMMASHHNVDRFISLAGAGHTLDSILLTQLRERAPILVEESTRILAQLNQGIMVDSIHPFLMNLFRPSVQPFLISLLKYDPLVEMAKLNIPSLIVNGTQDIQVEVEDANRLNQAAQQSTLLIIDDMNHVLKTLPSNASLADNMASYNKPELPLNSELVQSIISFIR